MHARALGGVHRGVGLSQHRDRVDPALAAHGPRAERHEDSFPVHHKRFGRGPRQSVEQTIEVRVVPGVLEDDHELVTAEPRDEVGWSNLLAQPARRERENGIAGCVPEGVVDQLETVDVEEHDVRH